jgi:hypothetical protein
VPSSGAEPIGKLGRKRIACGLADASANPDRYLDSKLALAFDHHIGRAGAQKLP